MALPLADIGDALVTAIQVLNPAITTERLYIGQWKLGDVSSVLCTVMPRSELPTVRTRKIDATLYGFDIIFRKKLTPGTDAARTTEIDGLLEMVNDIVAGINRRDMADAKWTGEITRDALFVSEHYAEWNQFTAVVGVQYLQHIEAGP